MTYISLTMKLCETAACGSEGISMLPLWRSANLKLWTQKSANETECLEKITWPSASSLQMITNYLLSYWACGSAVKNLPANAGDLGDVALIPGSWRSPGEGNGNPLQYSCLRNPMDREAWWATVYEVTKSQTWVFEWLNNNNYNTSNSNNKNDNKVNNIF